MLRILIFWAALLCPVLAWAGYVEPVACGQEPAFTGAVTKTAGSCATTVAAAGASQRQPGTPTAPASTSLFKMQGLAGTITPTRTGAVLLIVSGDFTSTSTTAGDGIQIQLSHGTGTAPINAATLTGTQDGAILKYTNPTTVTAADVFIPFQVNAVVTGLALNTAVWIDLAAESVATISKVGVANVSISAIEQ